MTQSLAAPHSHRRADDDSDAGGQSRNFGLLLVALLAVAVPLLTVWDVPLPGRTLLALAYVLLIPGVPLALLLRLPGRLATVCLSVALSLAAQLLISVGMLRIQLFDALSVQLAASTIGLLAILVLLRVRVPRGYPKLDVPPLSQWPATAIAGVRTAWPTLLGLGAAMAIWLIGLSAIDINSMNNFGFISVVGWTMPLALVLLAALAVIELRREELRVGWIVAIAVSFTIIMQGSMSIVEPDASLPVGYLHVGFADYIADHGSVLGGYDARFSWPGFFALLAGVAGAAGLSDATDLLRWAPLLQDLLIIFPLVLLARSLGSSRRIAWLAVILYACGNWFQQDYLSPQALSLLLAVTVIAVLASSTKPPVIDSQLNPSGADRAPASFLRSLLFRPSGRPERIDGLDGPRSLWLGAALLTVFAAVVVTHQLTPIVLTFFLAVFAFARRTRFPGMWIVAGLMTIAWISFGATDFWLGHLDQMFGGVGNLSATLNSGVVDRISGDAQHQQMLFVRIALSAAFVVLSLVGLIRMRRGVNVVLVGGLAFVPFSLLALQSYGGEVLVRCFLFALPALAISGAEALMPLLRATSRVLAAAVGAVLAVLSITGVAARGANAGFERITDTQLAAVAAIEAAAPDGGTVASMNYFSPLGLLEPGLFRNKSFSPSQCGGLTEMPSCIVLAEPNFLYVSAGQQTYGELVEGRPQGWASSIAGKVLATANFAVIYQADDVVVLQHIQPGSS